MKAHFIILLIIGFFNIGLKVKAQQGLVNLTGEKEITIHSKILKRDQNVLIRVPQNYHRNPIGFPVIYYFDAHDRTLSNSITSTIDRLMWTHDIPDVITVGIPHKDRSADLSVERRDSTSNLFYNFLSKELVPYIDSAYKTIEMRVFIGHSIGAQFLCNALSRKPNFINGAIAVSPASYYPPSENWFKNVTANRLVEFVKEGSMNPIHFYTCSGTAGFQEEQFLKGALRLDSLMTTAAPKGIHWRFTRFDGFNHGNTPLLGVPDGLTFIFKDWHFTDSLMMRVLVTNEEQPLEVLKNHKNQIKNSYGLDIPIPKFVLWEFAKFALQKQLYNQAEQIAFENINIDPEASVPYGLLGDIYSAQNKNNEALNYYNIAISKLNKDESKDLLTLKEKIDKLQSGIKK